MTDPRESTAPMHVDALLDHALSNAGSATSYRISCGLAASHPGMAVLETDEGEFDPWEFGHGGQCDIAPDDGSHAEMVSGWNGPGKGTWTRPDNACLKVRWNEHELRVVQAGWVL